MWTWCLNIVLHRVGEVASYINDAYETAGFCFPLHLSAVTIEIFVSSLITVKYAATDLTQALSVTCCYCDACRISPSVTVHVSSARVYRELNDVQRKVLYLHNTVNGNNFWNHSCFLNFSVRCSWIYVLVLIVNSAVDLGWPKSASPPFQTSKLQSLSGSCRFPARLLQFKRLTLSSIYQTASKCPAGVPDAPAGLLEDAPSDPARLFSSLRPSVCGIIPARLIWSRSFVSAPAAAARMNQRSFYTRSEASL